MRFAAGLAVALLAVVSVFQIVLALGAPLGKAAWGGSHQGVLPTRLRIASAIAALLIYPMIAWFVLASAGLVDVDVFASRRGVLMWALVGLFTLGAVANLASRSKAERPWALVSFLIAVCCAVVAAAI